MMTVEVEQKNGKQNNGHARRIVYHQNFLEEGKLAVDGASVE